MVKVSCQNCQQYGQVTLLYHFDQMSQRSQVSRVALWMTSSKVLHKWLWLSHLQGHLLSSSGQLRKNWPWLPIVDNHWYSTVMSQDKRAKTSFLSKDFIGHFGREVWRYSAVSLVQPNTERLISQLLFGLEFWRSLEGDLKSPMHCTIHLKFT